MALRSKSVSAGGWRTLEWFWNVSSVATFRQPEGARIRVLYGVWPLDYAAQSQRLDGEVYKKLVVGKGSVVYARMQINVVAATTVTYDVSAGGVAVSSPDLDF